jgi:predicted RNA-binding Zn-ribbon protein involved in translation (DUF1610 family)
MKAKIKKEEPYIKFCPKCNSKEVTHRGMIGTKSYSNAYVCLSCGFQSPLFPELPLHEAKNLPDKPKEFIPSRLPVFSDYSNMWRGAYNSFLFFGAPSLILISLALLLNRVITLLHVSLVILLLLVSFFYIRWQRDRVDKEYNKELSKK